MQILNQFKDHNSCNSQTILINLNVHQLNMLINISIQFQEIWFTGTLVMANLKFLNQFKYNNSYINYGILIKLDVHRHVIDDTHWILLNSRTCRIGNLVTAQSVQFTMHHGQ